jgi:UDP-N-acetylmuramoylalanine--D-glutamate ligase
VLVHGLGRFGGGREALRFLQRRGCRVRIADKSDGADLQAERERQRDLPGLDWQLGREDEGLLDGVDAVVVNPAIPDGNPLLQAARARGLPVTQEVDLFLAAYPGKVVGITGTNGKSTTSTLLFRALQRAGIDALLGGNIGNSLLADEAAWRSDQIAVLEISSFQLERLDVRRRVAGAVITRVGKDHLDRHGSLHAYHAAKARLAASATDFLVHAADDAVAAAFASDARVRARFHLAPPERPGSGLDGDWIVCHLDGERPEPIVHRAALRLLGGFQVENVMAASTTALLLGARRNEIGLAMANAAPLPFRLQLVATVLGVRIYDNGVSTEIESTRSALQAIAGKVHWVGGGKSKDGDHAAVAAAVAPRIASAHLFGAAAEPLASHLHGRAPCTVSSRLDDALAKALAGAAPGDALLFSPAFASFDQYPNFRARALEFHEWLARRRAEIVAPESAAARGTPGSLASGAADS